MESLKPKNIALIAAVSLALFGNVRAEAPVDDPLTPRKKPTDLMNRSYLLGDWGGVRIDLENKGVVFDLTYVNDYINLARADTFGKSSTDFGRVRFSLDIDFGKLANIDGLSFHFSAINQTGENAGANLGGYTNPSSIDGTEATRVDTFWLQQKLFGGIVIIRAGQLAQQDDYGVQEYGASFLMEPLGYAFGNLFGNVTATFDPASKPGVELQIHPGGGFYIKSELQGGETDPYGQNDPNGLSFDTRGDGVLATEIGWRKEELTRAPLPPATDSFGKDGKSIASVPPRDGIKTLFEGGLPAVYKIGLYNNFGDFTNPKSGKVENGNYLIYGMANQALFRESHYGPRYFQGLDGFVGADYSPRDVSFAYLQVTGGLRYTGLVPTRDADTLGLGLVYTKFSGNFNTPESVANNGRYSSETAVELTYGAKITPWFLIQPTVQYYFNPGGADRNQDAFVVGVRTKIVF